MLAKLARATLLIAALAVAGCNESSVKDFSPKGASRQLPQKILAEMQSKGMQRNAPIMGRIFKEEGKVEIWKQKTSGRYDLIAQYDICKWSGKLGPKFTEGDRQAPEGFYTVRPGQMNPNSSYHLSFNIGYPNAYDRANGRSGSNLMVHGACSSAGCYSMTDAQIEEIYAFARDAFQGGQTEFQIEAFPFRMTAANMARYKGDPNYKFWAMLKEGYDHFEITKVPPKVDVCEKRYVFNQVADGNAAFSPTAACPASSTPPALETAFQSYRASDQAVQGADAAAVPAPKPSILGIKEAKIVSEWTHRRARGEHVPIEPPSMQPDGSVVVTSRMGRIDSEVGRQMAARDAAEAEKKRIAEEKAAEIAAAKEAKLAAKEAEKQAKLAAKEAREHPEAVAAAPAPQATEAATDAAQATPPDDTATGSTGILGSVRKRISNIFGS
jgi:murein L,D-transpeptidase YafK